MSSTINGASSTHARRRANGVAVFTPAGGAGRANGSSQGRKRPATVAGTGTAGPVTTPMPPDDRGWRTVLVTSREVRVTRRDAFTWIVEEATA